MDGLYLSGLQKSYGRQQLLHTVSLQLKVGECVGIFGKNGSGKSTLLQCIFGTISPDHMQLQIDYEQLSAKEVRKQQKIAYLPQDSFLPPEKKVRNIIPIMYPDGELQDRIFYTPGIHRIENTKVGHLSLGELRFLEVLLIGYLPHPFLLLDEPFSMLQPIHKERITALIHTLKKEKGIIITDHYYQDVWGVTDRNLLLTQQHLIPIHTQNDLITHGYLRK